VAFFKTARNYLAADAAEAGAAAEAASLAASTAEAAEEAASAGAEAAGATTTAGAGAGAGASVLPQADRAAAAATIAAKTRDLFIFNILDELRKQFSKTVKRKPEPKFKSCMTDRKESGSFLSRFQLYAG
jgi:hypothetical protein